MWLGRVDCSVGEELAEWMQRWSGALCPGGGPWWVVSLRALGLVLFNTFIANTDSGSECIFSNFAMTRNLCPAWEVGPWEILECQEVQEFHLGQRESQTWGQTGRNHWEQPCRGLRGSGGWRTGHVYTGSPGGQTLAAAFLCSHFSSHQSACFVKKCHSVVWANILQEKLDFLEQCLTPKALCAHCRLSGFLKRDVHSWDCREETRLQLSVP